VCEQPSEKAHLRRLEAAARARGHQLSALVIGANRMGNEGNEWVGSFIRKYGWRAALVEPVPQLFAELQANFRGGADVSVHQLAVHANRSAIRGAAPGGLGQCGFFYTEPKCSGYGHESFNKSGCGWKQWRRLDLTQMGHVAGGGHTNPMSLFWQDKAKKFMQEALLPCMHIEDVFEHVGLAKPDLLFIDTEGHDFHLIEALDLSKVRPLAIEFETKAFTRKQLAIVQEKLKKAGYRVYDANATPHSAHWRSTWTVLEIFAVRTDGAAPVI